MLPKFLQPCLASYDLQELNLKEDKRLIITQVLNKGDDEALRWLGRNYSQKEIKEAIVSPMRGMWLKNILAYWQKIFNLKLSKETFNKAVLDLRP